MTKRNDKNYEETQIFTENEEKHYKHIFNVHTSTVPVSPRPRLSKQLKVINSARYTELYYAITYRDDKLIRQLGPCHVFQESVWIEEMNYLLRNDWVIVSVSVLPETEENYIMFVGVLEKLVNADES